MGYLVHDAGGRVVGEVANGVFAKRLVEARHKFRDPLGWAFDEKSLAEAREFGASVVCIRATDTGKVYTVAMGIIEARGEPMDWGYGLQVLLRERYWTVTDPSVHAKQLALWGSR